MKKKKVINCIEVIAVAAFLLTGCQSNTNSAETEALRQQIARLEQQISDLEQQAAQNNMPQEIPVDVQNDDREQTPPATDANVSDNLTENSSQPQENMAANNDEQSLSGAAADNAQQAQSAASVDSSVQSQASGTSIDGLTTYTMTDLSAMVDAFVAKAGAAAPSGTVSENMEQFFALKQEEKQIDDILDRHEDELENLYRKKSLTREEYNRLERELDLLEDKLDDMEDQLEFVFGIDD